MAATAPLTDNVSAPWVVIGGDGLIGSRLARCDEAAGPRVIPTTRRGAGRTAMQVDLATGDYDAVVEVRPAVVFLCAALTGMKACEDEPALARRINVTAPVDLATRLMREGAFVIFLSSNTVFDGNTPHPEEHSPLSPANAYGRQKAEAEQALRSIPGAERQLAVVRLSKVLVHDAGVPAQFRRRLESGETCEAFDDLLMSPVSAPFVVTGLREIARRAAPGIFHLAGASVLSYADFARDLARRFGWDVALVRPTSCVRAGADTPFRPRHPELGMSGTRRQLGIDPEPLEHFWSCFCSDVNASRAPEPR